MNKRVLGAVLVVGCGLGLLVCWWPAEPRDSQRALPEESAAAATDVAARTSSGAAETRTGAAPAARPPPSLPDSPLPEDDYLAQLQELNVSDKRAALTLVEKGEQWYPASGRAAEARRAMRVTLLVDLGQMPEARKFTREFIAQYPDSPYRPLVQGVTGIHPRPSGPRSTTSPGAPQTP